MDKKDEHIGFICGVFLFVLTHKAFRFGDEWFVGTAMGSLVAPTVAYYILEYWEEKYIYNMGNPFVKYIQHWSCFIDDLLIVWPGSEEQFGEFVEYVNKNYMNTEFWHILGVQR